MKEKIMNRRRLLTSLGLLAGAAFAAPLILNINEARASSCDGGGHSKSKSGGGRSNSSSRMKSSNLSTPSGAESGPSSKACTDIFGASVRCNPT